MIVSRSRRILFVHVHRTGGSTVSSLLLRQLSGARQLGGQHSSVTEASTLLGEDLNGYFKFALVRNPWERIVSWWSVLRDNRSPHGAAGAGVSKGLEAYLVTCLEAVGRGGPLPFPAEQMSLLAEPGGIVVDDIGRYERYEEDVRRIFGRLDLKVEELPRTNTSRHDPYQTYYNEATRRLVMEIYPRDTRDLGYEF